MQRISNRSNPVVVFPFSEAKSKQKVITRNATFYPSGTHVIHCPHLEDWWQPKVVKVVTKRCAAAIKRCESNNRKCGNQTAAIATKKCDNGNQAAGSDNQEMWEKKEMKWKEKKITLCWLGMMSIKIRQGQFQLCCTSKKKNKVGGTVFFEVSISRRKIFLARSMIPSLLIFKVLLQILFNAKINSNNTVIRQVCFIFKKTTIISRKNRTE